MLFSVIARAGRAGSSAFPGSPPTFVVLAMLVLACREEPVQWANVRYSGAPREPLEFAAPHGIPSDRACAASWRVAAGGGERYATWWDVRADSSAALMVARAGPDSSWGAPAVADSADHSSSGCGRPAPAIAVDGASGYVHLAYFAAPRSGPGIFFAHSMDSARTFHVPVPVVFGRNPSRVSVASNGDRVAVAYEDPNAAQSSIGVALSVTMGHIFGQRTTASGESGIARQPVVRLSGDSIQVWWSEYSPNPAISATRPLYRSGMWK